MPRPSALTRDSSTNARHKCEQPEELPGVDLHLQRALLEALTRRRGGAHLLCRPNLSLLVSPLTSLYRYHAGRAGRCKGWQRQQGCQCSGKAASRRSGVAPATSTVPVPRSGPGAHRGGALAAGSPGLPLTLHPGAAGRLALAWVKLWRNRLRAARGAGRPALCRRRVSVECQRPASSQPLTCLACQACS